MFVAVGEILDRPAQPGKAGAVPEGVVLAHQLPAPREDEANAAFQTVGGRVAACAQASLPPLSARGAGRSFGWGSSAHRHTRGQRARASRPSGTRVSSLW